MTGAENNIKTIKLLYGTNHSPSLDEKDSHSTDRIEHTSAKNIISFLYERGIVRSLFSKVIFIWNHQNWLIVTNHYN